MSSRNILSIIRLAKPQFRSNEDKLAFAVHAYVLAQDYKLVATGPAAEDDSTNREEIDVDGWTSLPHMYSFRYQDSEGTRPSLYLKCVIAGPTLLVQWTVSSHHNATERSSTAHLLELSIAQYTTDVSTIPLAYQNMDDFSKKMNETLGKDLDVMSSTEKHETPTVSTATQQQQPEGQSPQQQPYYAGYTPHPQYEDRLPPGILPSSVGYDDVVPPGFRPPGYLGGESSLMEGPPRRGGGMHVGPGHPIFGPGKFGEGVGVLPGSGGHHGPTPGLPPGARWDPIGPPGTRGFRPGDYQQRGDPSKPHPDVMQPGPGKGTDWDSFYG